MSMAYPATKGPVRPPTYQSTVNAAVALGIEEQNEFWRAYVAKCNKLIADARDNQTTLPDLLPHPEDVVIDDDTGVSFIGPVDEEQAAKLDKTLRMLKVLIMQDALDQRLFDCSGKELPYDRPGSAMLFMHTLHRSVPKRLKMSDGEIVYWMMRYESTPKRSLLKMLYRAWNDLGVKVSRGQVFPSLGHGIDRLTMLGDFITAVRDGHLDRRRHGTRRLRRCCEGIFRRAGCVVLPRAISWKNSLAPSYLRLSRID